MIQLINDKAKDSLLAYAGAVADDQSIRVMAQLEATRKAIAEGNPREARDAFRIAVDQMVVLGHVIDHLTYVVNTPKLAWPLDRGLAPTLESMEANLGKIK